MILMVYNKQVCKEFLLPNMHDADYEIRLHHDRFHLRQDVTLKLEITDAGWCLCNSQEYFLKYSNLEKEKHFLKDKDIIELKTRNEERLKVIVVDEVLSFQVMEKYDIAPMREISIGKSNGNIIQYKYMELVSGNHGTLWHHSDGWYLTDESANGIFNEGGRITGNHKLRFGEHINIFGLHLIFLGTILAVGTHYGELHVKEDILKCVEIPVYKNTEQQKKRTTEEAEYFNRSPRNLPIIFTEEVEIEAPPSPKISKQKPVFLTVGPAFTMAIPMMLGCGFAIFGSKMSGQSSSAFMYTGLITAVGSALIGVLWAFMNLNYSKKEQMEEEGQRFNAYSNYLIKIADALREKYQHNVSAMLQIYPSAGQCSKFNKNSSSLWNRNYTHNDFLFQRLGLGDQPFQVNIHIPKEKFTLLNDSLLEKPKMISEEYKTLHQVPVGISFLNKPLIGLVGGKGKRDAIKLMHTLVAQIAANHCYTDVKMIFVYREEDRERQEEWECMRWFPHVWSEDKNTRYMAADEIETSDIFFELTNILRVRSQSKGMVKPHYVLFISDPSLLEGEMLTKYIYEKNETYGLTTVLMVEDLEQLPNACEDVIEKDQYFQGTYNLMNTLDERKRVKFDEVSKESIEQMGRTLANIRVNEIESTSEIPNSLDFFSMYGVYSLEEFNVLERWRKNRNYNSMKVLIGKKAGNADCYLDIHEKYHGPHGLIAGTTGSGKSETLQTYILSLAINFSPEDVSFFIIDFKGGGMANLFSNLPHLTGQISNLSGNQVRRAMISIKSENMRRQKLFSEYGVNNINLYTRLYKNHEAKVPIPHLFIIIDEFAELKREEPDFMRELISVAQVGRSLGVHLILATQKPSGTVDDNIWSNSKFRLCLRVQDRQDSNDMLHKQDAAFITQAGRCYLQVGNDEIYELFQSGWSGAIYEADRKSSVSIATMITRTGKTALVGNRKKLQDLMKKESDEVKEITQLDAVIEYLCQLARENHYSKSMQLWLPVLKEQIYLKELEGYEESVFDGSGWKNQEGKWRLEAYAGLYDDPENQAQKPFKISFSENGHYAVCGAVVSGKSTFLQTVLYSFINTYSPEMVQMYLLDFSSHMLSSLAHAPQVGGIIYDNEEDKLAKFIYMLGEMLDERKKLLQGGNYSQYVQAYGVKLPALIIAIDNYANFRDKSGGKYDDILLRLTREGVGYGIYLIVTASGFGVSEIPSRMGDNIRTVISLEQADKFKYMEVMRVTRLSILPESDVKGRGLALIDGRILEFQTALALEAADDFIRGQHLETDCDEMRRSWKGECARPIPEIPENPLLAQFKELPEYRELLGKNILPLGYWMDNAKLCGVSLAVTYCYTISGKSHTGKTNVLKMLLHAAYESQGELCIIEKGQSELKRLAEEYGAEYIKDDKDLFAYFKNLIPEFTARNKKKREWMESGLDETEVYETMQSEKPIFIFLADLDEFFKMVYRPESGVGNMAGFVENIMEKGSLHQIYFFGSLKSEDESSLVMYRAYNFFVGYKKGVHLGGNFSAQKVFGFQNIPFANLSKSIKKGLGYVPDEEDETVGIQVVIPLAKR
ncbi:MAG: type VII secretion protein EssC [Hespellia sp.]|nr:type VII secretion protein EssC [Hespellia sp.]